MRRMFTKSDLETGDIIETRNGERGVVIPDKNCIVYQAGGFDELDVFTDDLFVDGPQREGDIFKVWRDLDDPLGFTKLLGNDPVFRRRNGKETKKRAAELDDKYDMKKGRARTFILEPHGRKCQEKYIEKSLDQDDLDLMMSEAPSMTVCGQLKIDRAFIPVPNAENVFFVYNPYQEEWHLQNVEKKKEWGHKADTEPVVIIPEENIRIHSRCVLVRTNSSGELEDLSDEDWEKAKEYINQMRREPFDENRFFLYC